MDEKRYFTCKVGSWDDADTETWAIDYCLQNNQYILHLGARFPSIMHTIQKGDTVLLMFYGSIIAYSKAKQGVRFENDNYNGGWCRIIDVEKWKRYDESKIWLGVDRYGISMATIAGGGQSAVKQVTPEYAKRIIEQIEKRSLSNAVTWDSETVISDDDVPLGTLFSQRITIPSYQRTYCWGKSQIIDLLETFKNWKLERAAKPLHLGTIILKANGETYDIIDGQQRLITLSVLLWLLEGAECSSPLLKQEISNTNAQNHISAAKKTISDWIKYNNIENKTVAGFIEGKVHFCVVVIPKKENEQLAYTFFNSLNSSGKKLTDYDLLKSHHLRYVKGEKLIKKMAANWDFTDGITLSYLMEFILYRSRCWIKKNSAWSANNENRLIYKHFASKPKIVDELFYLSKGLNFNSTIKGGEVFFSYIEYYSARFSEFTKTKAFDLLKLLNGHSRNVLKDIITANLFLFYCKFGERYLNDALFAISLRVSVLRNETYIRSEFINKPICSEILMEINSSVSPSQFFDWALSPTEYYQQSEEGHTKNAKKNYWGSLKRLCLELKENGMFIDISRWSE